MLLLIRGLPGSGKTTLAKQFADRGWVHYEADLYFETEGGYEFDATKLRAAHKWCLGLTMRALMNGNFVVVSNTFTTAKEIRPYVDAANVLGVSVKIITVTGDFGSIHNVPESVLNKMKSRWEELS